MTFAIPFYRGRAYLERAIASVRRQRNPAWELLVCDDCGPEPDVAEAVRSCGDPRIRYHRNEANLGMAGNWNRCLDLAGADLVNLLHADDEALPGYADLMIAAAARDPGAVAFFCGARVIDGRGRPSFSLPDLVKCFLAPPGEVLRLHGRPALEALLHGDFIMCPTVCYRKSRLGARRFSPAWLQVQDLELFSRLLLEGETLVGLPARGYAYRRHAGNTTAAHTESLLRFREESRLYDALGRAAAARGWTRAARLARGKGILKLHLLYRAAEDLLRRRPAGAWRKLAFLRGLYAGEAPAGPPGGRRAG